MLDLLFLSCWQKYSAKNKYRVFYWENSARTFKRNYKFSYKTPKKIVKLWTKIWSEVLLLNPLPHREQQYAPPSLFFAFYSKYLEATHTWTCHFVAEAPMKIKWKKQFSQSTIFFLSFYIYIYICYIFWSFRFGRSFIVKICNLDGRTL